MKNIINYIQEAIVKGHISKKDVRYYKLYKGLFRNKYLKMFVKIDKYEDVEYIMKFINASPSIKKHTLNGFKQYNYPLMLIPHNKLDTMIFGHNPVDSKLTKYEEVNDKIKAQDINIDYWESKGWSEFVEI